MTEEEFLQKRMPFWLENDNLEITFPTGTDRKEIHSHLAKKYHYNWLHIIRGYYWPESHVQLYHGDYETPNCTTYVALYLFNYFPDIKYIGFGCIKGNPGEIWKPKICITRNIDLLKDEIRGI